MKNISFILLSLTFFLNLEAQRRNNKVLSVVFYNVENLFVNHWSSRYGGMLESEPRRIECALNLRQKLNKILEVETNPRFMIMGDFNDEPTNKSVMEVLGAANKRKNIARGDLYNLYFDHHNIEGMGEWGNGVRKN